MNTLTVHTPETMPADSRALLEGVSGRLPFVPNILNVLAESPTALAAYMALSEKVRESSLPDVERNMVLLIASRENGCTYCVAAHSLMALSEKVPAEVVDGIREGRPLADKKLQAFRQLVESLLNNRGWPEAAEVSAFTVAGYSKAQMLEVIVGIAFKTISNYANHLADTPLDAPFKAHKWAPGE